MDHRDRESGVDCVVRTSCERVQCACPGLVKVERHGRVYIRLHGRYIDSHRTADAALKRRDYPDGATIVRAHDGAALFSWSLHVTGNGKGVWAWLMITPTARAV